jgi:hypothetical protein
LERARSLDDEPRLGGAYTEGSEARDHVVTETGGSGCLGFVSLPLHEPRAKRAFRFQLIVTSTPKPHALDRGLAAPGHGIDVVEFEKPARSTALAGLAHEGALAAIALPDRPTHMGGDTTGAEAPARRPKLMGGPELLLLVVAEEQIDGPVVDERGIA